MQRLLTGRDRVTLNRFLSAEAASTMFLRSNMNAGSMQAQPEGHYDGAYVGSFESGLLVGVACHTGNGMLLGHGSGLVKATRAALKSTAAPIRGITADFEAASAILDSLDLTNAQVQHDSREVLYELALANLVAPSILQSATCRAPRPDELDLLAEWREAYALETMGTVWGSPRDAMQRYMERDASRVLELDGQLVAYCHLNAQLIDMVQVGGVWTPPALRGRGYGRAVVAGTLQEASGRGVKTGILFTAASNRAARRAYEAIGFTSIGVTRLVIFDPPLTQR